MSEKMPTFRDVSEKPSDYMTSEQIQQSEDREVTLAEGRKRGVKEMARELKKDFNRIVGPSSGIEVDHLHILNDTVNDTRYHVEHRRSN